jgi:hypothetical protein
VVHGWPSARLTQVRVESHTGLLPGHSASEQQLPLAMQRLVPEQPFMPDAQQTPFEQFALVHSSPIWQALPFPTCGTHAAPVQYFPAPQGLVIGIVQAPAPSQTDAVVRLRLPLQVAGVHTVWLSR